MAIDTMSLEGIDDGWISEGREVPFEAHSRSSTHSTGRGCNEKGPSRHAKGAVDPIPYRLLAKGHGMTTDSAQLSRRERQIMEIVYELGRATAAGVRERMPDPPSYSAVRAMLRILEDKGHIRHEQDGPRYVFLPTVPREEASETALRRLVRTFFAGSPEGAMAALLDLGGDQLDEEALERLADLIEEARREES